MILIRYDDPLKFQSSIKDFLLKHEAENNLPLGILANLIAGEYQENPPYLAQVIDNEETLLVVMRTPPSRLFFLMIQIHWRRRLLIWSLMTCI
jgi:hypothetical protein